MQRPRSFTSKQLETMFCWWLTELVSKFTLKVLKNKKKKSTIHNFINKLPINETVDRVNHNYQHRIAKKQKQKRILIIHCCIIFRRQCQSIAIDCKQEEDMGRDWHNKAIGLSVLNCHYRGWVDWNDCTSADIQNNSYRCYPLFKISVAPQREANTK